MKERGIIFNGEMVRATLSGQKTQTRRVVKSQPDEDGLARLRGGPWMDTSERVYRCPFGEVGDRLYVRETWGVVSHAFDDDGFMISWTPDRPATAIHEMPFGKGYYSGHAIYAADGAFTWGDDDGHEDGRSCWKPSIHMPRAASRILLEITDVRVERLNDISEEDCWAEGIDAVDGRFENAEIIDMARKTGCCIDDAKPMFALLWQSIYGEESWQANPWCWTITFKRIEGA
ncbi:hypothetical protein C5E26_07680 [Pectobacterium parmentieri]|uniref:hypothetical protein n=1 Tax=Pectobacterium parmentieri TaxID=1905730 RepID=UPI000EAFAEB6|nr:hypothetical protein [Pectobacterium parmentieri]AYH00826.1 hypothetical protein C5E26_07680 [Pectobacterium parmentieri]